MVNSGRSDGFRPKILVFSTQYISDLGIDFAGGSHMHYPSSAVIIPLPCSSSIKPKWILHAIKSGFDGVFIAADGTDCPFLQDCDSRTATIVGKSQELLKNNGYDPVRLKMAAICSVCAEPFVNHMKNFYDTLRDIGPVRNGEVKV